MKRRVLIVTLIIAGVLSLTSSLGGSQAQKDNSPGVRLVTVNARSLADLPPRTNYVVDLANPGSIYEFDPAGGSIDFTRVALRTAQGEEGIDPRLGRALWREELVQWYTDGFRIGNVADLRLYEGLQPQVSDSPGTAAATSFTCDMNYCTCSGQADCWDMWHTNVCGGDFLACTSRSGTKRCICSRR
jgi:hypothetical protein